MKKLEALSAPIYSYFSPAEREQKESKVVMRIKVNKSSIRTGGSKKYPIEFVFDAGKREVKVRYPWLSAPFDYINTFSFDDIEIDAKGKITLDDLISAIKK